MNQRLQESLTNEKSFAHYNERLEEAWRPHEARIIREQARKDAQQAQATRNAAKAIIMFEKQEAERSPWIAASKMTVIQGMGRNDEGNKVEKWANGLPISMNSNRPVDEYIDYSPNNGWGTPLGMRKSSILAMNGRERVMPTTAGIGSLIEYDPEFLWAVLIGYEDKIKNLLDVAIAETQNIVPDVVLDLIIPKIPLPPRGKEFVTGALLLIGLYQWAKKAYTKWIEKIHAYMVQHHCSLEEAQAKISIVEFFINELMWGFTQEWLKNVLCVLGVPKVLSERMVFIFRNLIELYDKYRVRLR